MSNRGGKTYRPWEPQRYRQEAHSPAAKLPEGDLVFFLIDTVSRLDLRRFYAPYETETRGAPPFDPAMMVCCALSYILATSPHNLANSRIMMAIEYERRGFSSLLVLYYLVFI